MLTFRYRRAPELGLKRRVRRWAGVGLEPNTECSRAMRKLLRTARGNASEGVDDPNRLHPALSTHLEIDPTTARMLLRLCWVRLPADRVCRQPGTCVANAEMIERGEMTGMTQ